MTRYAKKLRLKYGIKRYTFNVSKEQKTQKLIQENASKIYRSTNETCKHTITEYLL